MSPILKGLKVLVNTFLKGSQNPKGYKRLATGSAYAILAA